MARPCGRAIITAFRLIASRPFSRRCASSVADHDRADAGTVPAVAVSITVMVAVPIKVAPIVVVVAVPEHAPIAIVKVVIIVDMKTACTAEGGVAIPATDACHRLGEAQLVLRGLDAGRAADTHRIGAIGPQRRAQ